MFRSICMKGYDMRSFKTLHAAGLAALLATGSAGIASAADMMAAPPPPLPVAAPAPLDAGGGFYLRGDLGLGLYDHRTIDTAPYDPNLMTVNSAVSGTAFIGAGAGYQFNSFLRADITGEYRAAANHRHNDSFSTNAGNGANIITGKVGGFVGLVNGYVDLGSWNRITPFLGVGIGMASMTMSKSYDVGYGVAFGSTNSAPDKTTTHMAWALHAGVAYDVTANLKAEGSYRYLHIGDVTSGVFPPCGCSAAYTAKIHNLVSHDLKVGLRYAFSDMASPLYAPGPLVRKY
jgi:opacity protein-like surface antigen